MVISALDLTNSPSMHFFAIMAEDLFAKQMEAYFGMLLI